MQVVEILLIVLMLSLVIFPVATFLAERRLLAPREPKGTFLRNMIEEQLRKDEPHEPFFFSLFERFENAPTGCSHAKIEYDAFKETLSTGESLAVTFEKYLRQWRATKVQAC
ncbi:MAG: hypothetical protein HXY34_08565 [Candidatus Thorarchaeota archaeon]|nr:hypothetical protein [Candidatus Thorarchaeota archaeon]